MSDSCAGLDVHSQDRSHMRLIPLPLAFAAAAVLAAPPAASAADVVPGKVIVRYKGDATRSERAAVQRRTGTRFGTRLPGGSRTLEIHDGDSVAKTITDLNRHEKVAYAVPASPVPAGTVV